MSGGQLATAYSGLNAISDDFWGSPVLEAEDGTLTCPGFYGKTIADSLHDKVFFAGSPTPGICEVSVSRERAFDEKKPAGSDGARGTLHGDNLAKIEIRIKIWTPDQWRALKQLWPVLKVPPYKLTTTVTTQQAFATQISPGEAGPANPTTTTALAQAGSVSTQTVPATLVVNKQSIVNKTKTPVTFDVYHPLLAFHNVKAVQIIGGRGPEPGPELRTRVFTITCVEYLPPKGKTTVTDTQPKGSALDAPSYPTPGSIAANTGP